MMTLGAMTCAALARERVLTAWCAGALARVDGAYVILSEVRATPERSRKIYVQ